MTTPDHRAIVHPGAPHPTRIEQFFGPMHDLTFPLQPGVSLLDAVTHPLAARGLKGAGVTLANVRLAPASYVMPALSPTPDRVAWYSETHEAPLAIDHANITIGQRDGRPFIHCHAIWRDRDGTIRGGHILPHETMIAAPATAFASDQVDIVATFDPETNFTLFQPVALRAPGRSTLRHGVIARIKPNQDMIDGIATICRRHNIAKATIRSGVGSLIGAEFEDGHRITEIPTEILIRHGTVVPGPDGRPVVDITIVLIDTTGRVHIGKPVRGRNPVLICLELVIEAHDFDTMAEKT